MKPSITDDIFYIGAFDDDLDLFESQYPVPDGISYNSYLIMDEKTVILDTVDLRKTDAWLKALTEQLNGRSADYLIVSHMEPDHSGNIKTLCEMYPEMKVVGNSKTFTILNQFFPIDLAERHITVKEGDILCTGRHTLHFMMTPMIHWPEVMMTYDETDQILFSADAFGKFGSMDPQSPWLDEARRYYINIVGKYGMQVQNCLKKAAALTIRKICPLHGPILSDHLSFYLQKYDIWSSYQPEESGVLVAYASIHGNTAAAAKKMVELLQEAGEENVVVRDLSRDSISDCVADAFRYDRMILAAATYDGGVFPPMEQFLHRLQHKAYQNRTVGIIENGSWAPMAAKKIHEITDTMKNLTNYETTVSIKSAMNPESLTEMKKLALEAANIES